MSIGDRKSDADDVKSELFVSDDSGIEPVVKKPKDSALDSIRLELKLTDENKTKRAAIFLKNVLIPILFLLVKRIIFSKLKMNLEEWKWQNFCTIYNNLPKKLTSKSIPKCWLNLI